MNQHYASMSSPIGSLHLAWIDDNLCALSFVESESRFLAELYDRWQITATRLTTIPAAIAQPIDAYFAGEDTALDRIALSMHGTEFHMRVWAALRKVPAGQTISYNGLAKAVGCPGGARAVGTANATNPVAIVVPCHRVIRSDGTIGGYGGGLDRKRWLLQHEGVEFAPQPGWPSHARLCQRVMISFRAVP